MAKIVCIIIEILQFICLLIVNLDKWGCKVQIFFMTGQKLVVQIWPRNVRRYQRCPRCQQPQPQWTHWAVSWAHMLPDATFWEIQEHNCSNWMANIFEKQTHLNRESECTSYWEESIRWLRQDDEWMWCHSGGVSMSAGMKHSRTLVQCRHYFAPIHMASLICWIANLAIVRRGGNTCCTNLQPLTVPMSTNASLLDIQCRWLMDEFDTNSQMWKVYQTTDFGD